MKRQRQEEQGEVGNTRGKKRARPAFNTQYELVLREVCNNQAERINMSRVLEGLMGSDPRIVRALTDERHAWWLHRCKDDLKNGRHDEVFEFIAKYMSPSQLAYGFVFEYIFRPGRGGVRKVKPTEAVIEWCHRAVPGAFFGDTPWNPNMVLPIVRPNLRLFVDGKNKFDRMAALLVALIQNSDYGFDYVKNLRTIKWGKVPHKVRASALRAIIDTTPTANDSDFWTRLGATDVQHVLEILEDLDVYVDVLKAVSANHLMLRGLERWVNHCIRYEYKFQASPWLQQLDHRLCYDNIKVFSRWNRWIPIPWRVKRTSEIVVHNETCATKQKQELVETTPLDYDTISIVIGYSVQ